MSETPKLLPLGTAVTLNDGDGTYIIIARGFQKAGDGFLAGYKGMPHPHGSGAAAKEIVIKQTQIGKVVHRGYETAEDADFAKRQMDKAKVPPAPRPPVAEPDLTIDLARPAATAPAAHRRQTAGEPGVPEVTNPRDPFGELRSKGKRK